MTVFSKVLCQPSMADPHLRPGRPLRDRRADAQSHIRGYRSSCGPHLGSSGAAAGGSLGIARAGLPVRIGNGAPPSLSLGLTISRDAGGLSHAGVAARRIVQPPWRGPNPGTPRSLTAHRSSDSSLEARPSVGVAPSRDTNCDASCVRWHEHLNRHGVPVAPSRWPLSLCREDRLCASGAVARLASSPRRQPT